MLKQKAKDLEESIKQGGCDAFDALFVVVSGHGLKRSIVTAAHKLLGRYAEALLYLLHHFTPALKRTEIHRIFSSQRSPLARLIPRIFLFDCCDGIEDNKGPEDNKASPKEEEKQPLTPPAEQQQDHVTAASTDWLWKYGEQNPDHRLAVLNAANEGFQSKLNVCKM